MGPVHRVQLGRHIHDAAPTLLDHEGRHPPGHLVGGDIVGLDDRAHDVVRHLPELLRLGAAKAGRVDCREGQAGIVDEDVHTAKPRQRHRDGAIAIGGPTQVRDERQDLPLWLGAGRLRLDCREIGVDVADREDMVSLPCKAKRHCAAEPAQAAGDDCDALFHENSPLAENRYLIKRCDA